MTKFILLKTIIFFDVLIFTWRTIMINFNNELHKIIIATDELNISEK